MSQENRFTIFNSTRKSTAEFHLFPQLPAEVRQLIWTAALQPSRRIISVTLEKTDGYIRDPNDDGAKGYRTVMRVDQGFSKLLRVNREARRLALRFYRLHVPGCFRHPGPVHKPMVVYVNPERDVIQIEWACLAEVLIRFLLDLKRLDPRGIGLVNLAWSKRGLEHFVMLLTGNQSQYGPFRRGISHVRQVYFVAESGFYRTSRWEYVDSGTVHFNHSLPIEGHSIVYEYLGPDPRPIGPDMSPYDWTGPLMLPTKWSGLLREVGFQPAHTIDHCFKVSFVPEPNSTGALNSYGYGNSAKATAGGYSGILTREAGERWLRGDWEVFPRVAMLRSSSGGGSGGADVVVQENEDVRPAFGFWLFPLARCGDATPGSDWELREFLRSSLDEAPKGPRKDWWLEISECKPELCLYNMI
ncbi:hypothetical protein B0I35DRAFT_478087 [Stachybotrys elegans]|uniref:2EXR domain-containing protein n=1 Tax=Stachybotrys elegans TaxID=80388 RepID=A0A8K0SSH1_9HYPO|nr:hypothetical protein B0I35DRAFT_478087 [Stachybotrys elegans]